MNWIVRDILSVCDLMFKEGLVDQRAGNVSYAFGEDLYITRSGSIKGSLSKHDIVKVPLRGKSVLDERASSEIKVHRSAIVKSGKRSVVHAHPVATVCLSFERELIVPKDSEGKTILGKVRVVDYSEVLNGHIFSKEMIVVVKEHGVFAVGDTPFEALQLISVLEHSCKIELWSRGL